MAIHVALNHKTQYRYDRRINLGPQVVRLRPAPHCRTPILSYSLKIQPENHFINWQQDPQGNYLARLVFPEPTTKFFVEVDLVAEMAVFNPFDFFLEPSAENYPFTYDAALGPRTAPVSRNRIGRARSSPRGCAGVSRKKIRTIDFLIGLNQRLQSEIGYVIRMEPGIQTCEQTLDSAHRLLPRFGLAAGPDPAPSGARRALRFRLSDSARARREAPRRPGRPHRRLHRSARLDRSLPARRGLGRARSHFRTVRRRRPHSARLHARRQQRRAHLRRSRSLRDGIPSRDVGAPDLRIAARHQAVYAKSSGRKSKRSDIASMRICGRAMCASPWAASPLSFRSTMPTAPNGPPALSGRNKRRLSVDLFLKLRDRFAPGALLHFGQGKWYPGEPLPRWALGCYWRKDGVPIWEDPSAHRGRQQGLQVQRRRCAPVSGSPDPPARGGRFVHHDGARRRLLLPVERAATAGQCRSARFQTGRSHRACGAGACFRRGAGQDGRLCASAAPDSDEVGHAALDEPALVCRVAAPVSGSRRFADGISFAARFAAMDEARRRGVEFRSRSVSAARQTPRETRA